MKSKVLFLFTAGQTEVGEENLAGARRHADALGWNLVPLIPDGGISAAFVRSAVSRLHPAGCIVDCSGRKNFPGARIFGSTPTVWLDLPDGDRSVAARRSLLVDNVAIAAAALRELKVTRPAAVAVVSSPFYARWARFRAKAFSCLAAEMGLTCPHFTAHRGEKPAVRAIRLARWIAELPRPCGVFAVNDISAWNVQQACLAAGLHIPSEIAIVGVDNIEVRDNALAAPLTSIRLDFERMGYVAARMLGEEIGRGTGGTDRTGGTGGTGGTGDNCPASRARPAHPSPSDASPVIVGPLMVVRRKSTSGRGRHEPRIDEAVAMIRREACEGLTVAALAARFPGSRRLFDIRFREAMGHSALDEILHVRLERVCELLAGTDTPVTAVGDFCGFDRYQTLDKLFRQRFKMSMRQWRLRNSRKFFSQK